MHIIFFAFLPLLLVKFCDGSVQFVSVIFRHGNRTIETIYPTDPYKDPKYWPEGYGQLTESGIADARALGEWLRRRYPDLMPSEDIAEDIKVRSTDMNRTIMSAKACLDGLFGSSQSIPIEIDPTSNQIFFEAEPCPRYDHLRTEFENSNPWYLQTIKENQDTLRELANRSGLEINKLKDVAYLCATFMVEKLRGYKLPDWAESMFPLPLGSVAIIHLYVDSYTDEMARLKIGPFVRELLKNMDDIVGLTSQKKMALYSGHDLTIADVMQVMRVFNGISPPYSAALLLELHQINTQYYVQVLYRNTTSEEPFALTLPECEELCPLPTFRKILLPLVPIDINSECQLHQLTQANLTSGATNNHQFSVDAFVVVTCYILCVATSQMLLPN